MPWCYRRAMPLAVMVVTASGSLSSRNDAGPPSEEQIGQATLRDEDREPAAYPHRHNLHPHANRSSPSEGKSFVDGRIAEISAHRELTTFSRVNGLGRSSVGLLLRMSATSIQ
jgi:hypothetical protein